ncbi:MAG: argininosuccinate lyase [Candidatus Omnitrophica bacterium]|nr:argininosuccinate lyase [Candidatus Omnitrophota bacterium]
MAKKLWGGRFTKEIDKDFFEFQKSIQHDHKLAKYDIIHSMVHTMALGWAKLLSPAEKNKLLKALKEIREDIKKGKFKYDSASEDVHTDIQNKIEKKIGKLALKLHTLRSRNDQIAFDEKLYCHDAAGSISNSLDGVLESLKLLAARYKSVSIVGYTHTQRAQKVLFRDYLGAFCLMLERDKKRISDFLQTLEISIGAGALAGSSIKTQYCKAIAEHAKNEKGPLFTPSLNTLDDVSNRDFVIELLSIISILQMHLSRLAEDMILYSTKEFNFVDLPEEFCTGSSMMPHKKNPDFMELVRGYTGRIYGNLVSILVTMKGLPLTYNRDMQLDKEPLFSSVEIIENELNIMGKLIKGIRLNEGVIEKALKDEDLYAVALAEKLVREHNIPFREAHDIVGKKIAKRGIR